MYQALLGSDKGPDLLYHLGQNPEEAARISNLPTAQEAMALGRIEASLTTLQPRTETGAPSPITPLTDGQGSQGVDPDNLSTEEWRQRREAEIAKRQG